jgi:prepilin-type N-terminal cleavage/methylation domain-containing protein
MSQKRGFTLLELLVVIAIIGILSSVVLSALNTARNKGKDASIEQDLTNLRTQAEIYYTGAVTGYGTQAWSSGPAVNCTGGMFSDPTVNKALTLADAVNGPGNVDCYAGITGYMVGVALTATTSSLIWWCVDQTGTGKGEAGALATTAPANNVCP